MEYMVNVLDCGDYMSHCQNSLQGDETGIIQTGSF